MYLISSAVNAGFIVLALIMALNSAIAAYYYLKPIVYIFLKEPIDQEEVAQLSNASTPIKTVIGFCAIATIISIFYIESLLEIISYYVQISGY